MIDTAKDLCELCNSETYAVLRDRCSLSVCSICDHVRLNGLGLPFANDPNVVTAVYNTVEAANKAVTEVFKEIFYDESWKNFLMQWHTALHDTVIKDNNNDL